MRARTATAPITIPAMAPPEMGLLVEVVDEVVVPLELELEIPPGGKTETIFVGAFSDHTLWLTEKLCR